MNFLARVVRYLFWLLVVSWSVALLRRAVKWMLQGGSEGVATSAGATLGGSGAASETNGVAVRKLVRDPVCGTHVAEVLAIPLRENGGLVHFCSQACRDEYVSRTQRIAANG